MSLYIIITVDTDNGRLCVGDVTGDISISRGNDAIGEIVPCLVFIYYRVPAGNVDCLQMYVIATHQRKNFIWLKIYEFKL